jgi:hypothetical protein
MLLEQIEVRSKISLRQVKAQIANGLNAGRYDVVVHQYDAPVFVKDFSKARQAADYCCSLNCPLQPLMHALTITRSNSSSGFTLPSANSSVVT